jgi:TonB family protein
MGGTANPTGADELEKLLSHKPSPGSLALLAPHLREAGAAERLKLSLSDSNWKTRATAARLVNLGAIQDLLPSVREALDKESETPAAEEQLRTLATIGGPSFDDALRSAEKRFSPELDSTFACILARSRGAQAIPLYFDALRDLQLSQGARETFFRLATRGKHDALIAASAMALSRRDSAAWQAVLNVAGDFGVRIDEPVLIAALGSSNDTLRGETAWYAAKSYCGSSPPNAAAILAALDQGERDAGPTTPELRFGSEVLRRVLGKDAVEDEAWIACLQSNISCHLDSDLDESPLIDFLTPREREAILRRNEANRPAELPRTKKDSYAPLPQEPLLRLVTGLPNGVAADLFDLESCHSTQAMRWLSLARVEFRPDGLPRRVTIGTQPPSASCQRTAQALFLMSDAPATAADPAERGLSYLALFDPEVYECTDRAAPKEKKGTSTIDVVRVRGEVVPPKIQKRITPAYPPDSRKKGEEGVSVYEAIISPNGCVEDPRLVQSSAPTLDVMGMEAVSRWRYTPATLNGRPVRVYLTVTVTYRLTR